jgi:hypothetical protein
MKKLILIILVALTSLSLNSFAHKDHGEEFKIVDITQEQAIDMALIKVNEQIESNELDSSWSSANSKTAVLERVNGRQSWKVSFTQLDNTKTEILNVFLTKTGEFISISK